jgi:hypothetical protein
MRKGNGKMPQIRHPAFMTHNAPPISVLNWRWFIPNNPSLPSELMSPILFRQRKIAVPRIAVTRLVTSFHHPLTRRNNEH